MTLIKLLLVVDLLAVLAVCIGNACSPNPAPWAPYISAGGTLAAVLVAIHAYDEKLKRDRSKDLLDAAMKRLQQAYDAIKPREGESLPCNDRFAWLCAARLLAESKSLGEAIGDSTHRRQFELEETYWQTRFRDLILPSGVEFPDDFYAASPKHAITWGEHERAPIAESSLAYLYRFANYWPRDRVDPLGDVAKFTDKEIEDFVDFGPRGLGRHLQRWRSAQREFGLKTFRQAD